MTRKSLFLAGCILAACTFGAQASVVTDDFNRPDGPLGGHWKNDINGSCAIVSGQATCQGLGTTLYQGATGSTLQADVYHNSAEDGDVALILGYAGPDFNVYVKLQSQDQTQGFEWYGFYFGENGNSNYLWSDERFAPLDSTVFSAHMVVSIVGDSLTMTLDTNFDTIPDQIYTASNLPLAYMGNGVGIGGLNWQNGAGSTMDNFVASGPAPVPEPLSLSIFGVGLAGFAARRRARKV